MTTATPAASSGDAAELARFEAQAHAWWDPGGEFRPLHDLNPVRTRYVLAQFAAAHGRPIAGALALDIGCGGGLLTEALAAAGADVLGTDLGATAIRVARLHALESGSTARYARREFAELRDEPVRFALITCMEMLEHVPDPGAIVTAAAELLTPGGTLVLSTIARTPKAYALAVLGAEYVMRLLPRGTHDYAKFLRPSELAALVRRAGLQVVDISGMTYNPFTRSAAIGGSPDVNYLLTARAA